MILTPHAIVGAAITNLIPSDPALGFGLAFASHYVLDMLPHTDYDISGFIDDKTKTVKPLFKNTKSALHILFISLDLIVAISICFLIFVRDKQSLYLTLVGIVGCLLPDFFQFLYFKYKNQPWIFYQKIHDKFHHPKIVNKTTKEKIIGTSLEIILPIFFIIIYFLLKNHIFY